MPPADPAGSPTKPAAPAAPAASATPVPPAASAAPVPLAKSAGGTSRRPPKSTSGTFPPEGSAAAAGRSQPIPVRQWPIVVVFTVVGVGLTVTALDAFRPGVITIGAGMLLACVLRIVLPEVGMLAVRSRFTDILVMGVLGVAIVVLALASEPNPVISIPFVSDVARFFGRGQS